MVESVIIWKVQRNSRFILRTKIQRFFDFRFDYILQKFRSGIKDLSCVLG